MSLRRAIDSKCRDCIHDKAAPGTWREQVAQCPCLKCPLWPFRPAPSGGPFADPPRDPAAVSREWVTLPVGLANSGHRRQVSTAPRPLAPPEAVSGDDALSAEGARP